MDKRMKKRATFAMLVALVDANGGKVDFNTKEIKRCYNDENEAVRIEYADGRDNLAYDADTDVLESAIFSWCDAHPKEFAKIIKNWA